MKCELCAKDFTGIVPYQQHLASEKHKKKVAQFSGGGLEVTKQDKTKVAGITNYIDCPACNMPFDSILQFQKHCMSLEHVVNVNKKIEAGDEVDSTKIHSVSSTTMDSDHHNVESNDVILPTLDNSSYLLAFSECKLCDKRFSGPEPYRQHLVSAAHKKKTFDDSPMAASQNPLSKFVCDSCKKVFSGPIPLRQHMVSDIHKKKLQQIELLKSYFGEQMEISKPIKDKETNIETTMSLFCNVCRIQCSGPAPYAQHMKGETHAKNLRKFESVGSVSHVEKDMESGQVGRSSDNNQLTFASPMLNVGVRNIMEVDDDKIFPEAIECLNGLQPEDVGIKEFWPDDLICFDDCKDSTEINIKEEKEKSINIMDNILGDKQPEEIVEMSLIERKFDDECKQNGKNEDSEKCELCNVLLRSKKETLSHFESIEHIKRKYPLINL